MKLLILLILFAGQAPIFAQWTQYPSLAAGLGISDACFVGSQTLLVTANRGILRKSTDYGTTWTTIQTPIVEHLYGISFSDSLNGIISANNGYILLTSDGGNNWQVSRPFPGVNFRRILFTSPQIGYIMGGAGAIYKTTDRGLTWTLKTLPNNVTATRMSFLNDSVGVITSPSNSLRTSDGGNSWQVINTGSGVTFKAVAMVKPGIAYVCADLNRIYKSTDDGISWSLYFTPAGVNSFGFTEVVFADSLFGVFMRSSESILLTEDGGTTFANIPLPPQIYFLDKLFLNGRNSIVLMNQSSDLKISLNKGNSWSNYTHYFQGSFNAVDAITGGYILVGDTGHIQFIHASYFNHTIMNKATLNDLMAVSARGSNAALAVGKNGTILRGNSTSNSWSVKNSGTTADLYGLSQNPGNLNIAVAVGDSGTILWTVNNGDTWLKKTSGIPTRLRSIRMINAAHAVAVGDSGTVLLTSNGGQNWNRIPVPTTENLLCITSISGNVIIGGENGASFKSNDSGRTWAVNPIGVSSEIRSLQYLSNFTIRAAVAPGKIYVSSNGGLSWHYDYNFENKEITTMFFLAPNTGAVVLDKMEFYKHTSPVPVELINLSALLREGQVYLQWKTASETNNRGFEIEKSTDRSNWFTSGFIAGNGNSTELHEYGWTDRHPEYGKNYYRLKQIDYNGMYEYSSIVEAAYFMDFSLSDNFPNPFNPSTKIVYTLPQPCRVVIELFDILGNSAGVILNGDLEAGSHSTVISSEGLSSGVYLYKLSAAGFTQTKKMVVMK